MVVSIFGVLKSGAAYLPILPSFPLKRVGEILDDASVALCLLQTAEMSTVVPLHSKAQLAIVSADGRLRSLTCAPLSPLPGASDPLDSNLCYVMYTSGSTGRPKGVMVDHVPLVQRVAWVREAFGVGLGDTVPLKTEVRAPLPIHLTPQ